MSGIPRLVAVLAAKDDHFFHTNSIRRRRPCGPEISSFGSRCRAVVKSCPGGAFAEPRKASQRAHGLAAHEARTPFGARAFPRHARERLPESGLDFFVLGSVSHFSWRGRSGGMLHFGGSQKARGVLEEYPHKTTFRGWAYLFPELV